MHRHVSKDPLDDLTSGRLIQAKATGEPVEAAHHVPDGGAFVRGFRIVAHLSTGKPMMTAVMTMVRRRPGVVASSASNFFVITHGVDRSAAERPPLRGLPGRACLLRGSDFADFFGKWAAANWNG